MGLSAYERSAHYYDLIYQFRDVDEANRGLAAYLAAHCPQATSLLDAGCGVGNQLRGLSQYDRVGVDLSPAMLEVARERLPGVPLFQQDMVDLSLERTFGVVLCLFGSIGYVRTPDRLHQAVAAMARHLEPGGLLMLEPWFTPEQFWDNHVKVNRCAADGVELVWMYRQERRGDVSVLPTHYLVGSGDGVEHWFEQHELGLFTDAQYRTAFTGAGLQVELEREAIPGHAYYVGRRVP